MRKVLFIFCCFFCVIVTLISLLFSYPKKAQVESEKDYIEIWHVDLMEGGVGSRLSIINSYATVYMNTTNSVVRVISHTKYSMESNFEKGIYPDIISYSNGLALPYDRLFSFQIDGEKVYATPWCLGGYLLIKRKDSIATQVIVSQQKYTLPLLAYHFSGVNLPLKCVSSSEKAIQDFYADKSSALLSTQRDIFRLERKGIEIEVMPLCEFNDLYQYLSLVGDKENYDNSVNFLSAFLRWLENSDKLKSVGMLTAKGYIDGVCEEKLAIFSGCRTIYATVPLITPSQIEKLQNQAINFNKEKESIKNTLKYLK